MSKMDKKEKPLGPAKGKTAVEALITGVAVAGALILLNVLTCGSRARLDLTEGRIYSLSDASRNLVSNLKEKVNIKGVFSNVPAEAADKVAYVDMLLSEYADRSNGRITYERLDPADNPELQEELRKDGVNKMPVEARQADSVEQVLVYFHVVFSHLDKKEVWVPPRNFTLEGLEYDFSTRIKRLGFGKKKVGVTQGFGEPEQAQILTAPGGLDVVPGMKIGLGDLYDVTAVNWKENPKAIEEQDVIIVNGPTDKVSEAAKYHLDQAIMRGKPVLFLVGGMRWQSGGGQQPQIPGMEEADQPFIGMPNDPGLFDLLEGYGFKVNQDVVIDGRNSGAMLIPPGSRGGLLVPRGLAPYAASLQKGEKQMLEGIDIVALPLPSTMTLVGALADNKDPDLQVMKLFETSPQSWTRNEVLAITREINLKPADEKRGPYLLGAAASGKFKSGFAEKGPPAGVDLTMVPAADPEAAPDAPKPAPVVATTEKESVSHTRLVVVSAPSLAADSTLIDLLYVNGFVALHNIVDWLAEETDLIAVRSKKPERPIEGLEPAGRTAVKYGNVIGAPLLLVLAGLVTWRLRERRRRNIKL